MKKTLLTLIAVLATLLPVTASAAVSTWSFEWNTSKNKGGQGFYNFGASAVEKDFYTTELNGLCSGKPQPRALLYLPIRHPAASI